MFPCSRPAAARVKRAGAVASTAAASVRRPRCRREWRQAARAPGGGACWPLWGTSLPQTRWEELHSFLNYCERRPAVFRCFDCALVITCNRKAPRKLRKKQAAFFPRLFSIHGTSGNREMPRICVPRPQTLLRRRSSISSISSISS